MPRANRHYIPGCIWHITHRCHKKEFLLKFAQDRQRFVYWLYKARERFGVKILNYTVTSNHIHLLLKDAGETAGIPAMIQLVAGRTGQEYNRRKNRKGAYWEDRYHATAIESGFHLRRCLTYIDLNMVRAGVVNHPEEWAHGGYHEIRGDRRRYRIIDLDALMEVLELDSMDALRSSHGEWIAEALSSKATRREEAWTRSIAVGSEGYVRKVLELLGLKGRGRGVAEGDSVFVLREAQDGYGADFGVENRSIASENTHFWSDFP